MNNLRYVHIENAEVIKKSVSISRILIVKYNYLNK